MWIGPKALKLYLRFVLALVPITLSGSALPTTATPTDSTIAAAYSKGPLVFEPNEGQIDRRVKFVSRGPGYGLFLTSTEAVLSLRADKDRRTKTNSVLLSARSQNPPLLHKLIVLRMRLERANINSNVSGLNELAAKSNYFIGNDPTKWRHNIPTFARVKYHEIYSGVDMFYYGDQQELEYDFVLTGGADPRQIEISFDDANRIQLDTNGDLVVSVADADVIEHKPVIYQEINGMRREVAGGYELRSNHTVGFKLSGYDKQRSLTIDPSLAYSTYLGSSEFHRGTGIAVDLSGNAYVTGYTQSSEFPTSANALQSTLRGPEDAFISKLNSTGSALVYSTYLGGSDYDEGTSIAVDASGDAYVTGYTKSNNFPTTPGAFLTTFSTKSFSNGFVSKLNSTGSALVYSTYLGGSSEDEGAGIALDASGDAYVTGWTNSNNFPTTARAFQTTLSGDEDAFVTKLNGSGSGLVYSTYLGGSGQERGSAIALDASGNAYVTGSTESSNFPMTRGAFQTTLRGKHNAFVTKLNSSGTALVYSTSLGGSNQDDGYGIALDKSGDVYVTGSTESSKFPMTKGAFQTTLGGMQNAFVSKLNSSGTALVYSTYLGGSSVDEGEAIALDSSSGNVYVTGLTSSNNYPTTRGAFQTSLRGPTNAFISELNSTGSALAYSTYLGGSNEEAGHAIALDASDNAYLTGLSTSRNFPTTAMAIQRTVHGPEAAFVSKLDMHR